MTGGEFVINHAPGNALAKVARRRGALIQRVISLLISLGIGVAIYYFFAEQLGDFRPWVIWFSVGPGVIWALISLTAWLLARAEVRKLGQGPAVAVTREGVWITGNWIPWPSVGALRAKPGRLGRSASLVVDSREGASHSVALDYLDALPATIDSAVRTLSGGRAWIDLSDLDA
ncbi:MAG: hypothetical protein IPL43_00410 [Micropruina sp.]|nr:hypothetical protein [Micropruina sp.]